MNDMRKALEAAREALMFYACAENYDAYRYRFGAEQAKAEIDRGRRARRVLTQIDAALAVPDESPGDAWRRGAEAAEGDAVDYDAMNPGIRRTVRWLRTHGFRTCDSGDGATHDHECDRDYAYVAIRDDDRPDETATRLLGLLREMGITVEQIGVDGGVWIQSSFDPVTGIGIVDVSHLSDAVLPPGIGAPPPYEPPAPERGASAAPSPDALESLPARLAASRAKLPHATAEEANAQQARALAGQTKKRT